MTSLPEFVSPASGDMWKPADAVGHLLIIDVHGIGQEVETAYAKIEPVRATVHDVDNQSTTEDALIFTGSLIGALTPRVGSKVLARLGQGTAKPGKNPPYVLLDASGDTQAVAAATAYLRAWQSGQFAAPATTTPPPAAQPAATAQTPDVAAAIAALQAAGMTIPGQ